MCIRDRLGDAMRVSQILLNLLSNAVKFTPQNGKVQLEIRQLTRKSNAATLQFIVSDTGRGMSEEFLSRLYEPFEQENSKGGTGLGMPITKNLVGLLGGTISVRSQMGRGTVFTVELPFEFSSQNKPCLLYTSLFHQTVDHALHIGFCGFHDHLFLLSHRAVRPFSSRVCF